MITIVLVDDHKLIQKGLKRSLESNAEFKVVGLSCSAEDGLLRVQQHRPDVAIFDLGLPDHSGLWLLRRARRAFPEMPILILSMHTECDIVATALRTGANGYLRKSADETTLISAVRAVLKGEIYLEPELALSLSGEDLQKDRIAERYLSQAMDTVLTADEMEVLRLTAAGRNNREMAAQVGVSVSTVKARLRSVFGKLNVKGRTQAVAAAASLGILGES